MKSLFALLPILPLTFAATNQVTTALTLDPDVPIYLGHVFLAPTMTFIAWIPSENKYLNEWCYKATDVSKDALFTLGGVDALQVQEYFSNQAYITREGNRFADCSITPESGKIGKCESVRDGDREGGQKFTGPGVRKWSCWLIDDERRRINATEQREPAAPGEGLADALFTPTATSTQAKNSILAGFGAAAATGS